MILDINSELRDFTYITNVYKCISNYKLKGHQIGRKIGDMLELLTMGAVYKNRDLLARLSTESKLEGYTTAAHKVEFCFFDDRNLFGAIECKCIGVEESTSGNGNNYLRRISQDEKFEVEFSGRWQKAPIIFTLSVTGFTSTSVAKINVSTNPPSSLNVSFDFSVGDDIKFIVDENENPIVTTPNGNMLEEVPSIIRSCKTVKFQGIDDGTAIFGLYDCYTGPQTIEKAKQASLVAMDLRKKIDGFWGKDDISNDLKRMNFILVLCEYSHWEEKSRAVIDCCIDHTVIVPDAVIIKAFETFEQRFTLNKMLSKISKQSFKKDQLVQNAINYVLDFFDNRIFYDVKLKNYVEINYLNNRLVVQPLL